VLNNKWAPGQANLLARFGFTKKSNDSEGQQEAGTSADDAFLRTTDTTEYLQGNLLPVKGHQHPGPGWPAYRGWRWGQRQLRGRWWRWLHLPLFPGYGISEVVLRMLMHTWFLCGHAGLWFWFDSDLMCPRSGMRTRHISCIPKVPYFCVADFTHTVHLLKLPIELIKAKIRPNVRFIGNGCIFDYWCCSCLSPSAISVVALTLVQRSAHLCNSAPGSSWKTSKLYCAPRKNNIMTIMTVTAKVDWQLFLAYTCPNIVVLKNPLEVQVS